MAKPFSTPKAYAQIQETLSASTNSSATTALPSPSTALLAASKAHTSIPEDGLDDQPTLNHILKDLVPGFNNPKNSANYYGFVTGGVLPIAEAADNIVTTWDQNVQVHLPEQSVSTTVEAAAGEMLVDLLQLREREDEGEKRFQARTFTTGATASNILGLACGRDYVLGRRLYSPNKEKGADLGSKALSVGEVGILEACRQVSIDGFQVLTTIGHSSLYKAASVVGLGRASVKDVGLAVQGLPWKFDFEKLEKHLKQQNLASIVVVSCGEVNTGRFATSGFEEMRKIRDLCDKYNAWLHVDGAFGLFVRALPPGEEFAAIKEGAQGIELADSITGDCHKLLNVPYDCGFFITHSTQLVQSIFQNPNAAYLSSTTSASGPSIPSPLNSGIENSRRFRALPVYAVLLSHGRSGLSAIFARQVKLARVIAEFVSGHSGYDLLPNDIEASGIEELKRKKQVAKTNIIVLFRARDEGINENLAARVNKSTRIMVSGTKWEGKPAVRIAVSTWMADEERDLAVVREVLEGALVN